MEFRKKEKREELVNLEQIIARYRVVNDSVNE